MMANQSNKPWWWGTVATFAYLWTAFTAIVMLLTSWFAVRESGFKLGFGLIQVEGRAALWIILPVGLCGIGAIGLLWRGAVWGKNFWCCIPFSSRFVLAVI